MADLPGCMIGSICYQERFEGRVIDLNREAIESVNERARISR